jgi:hypothetical protein
MIYLRATAAVYEAARAQIDAERGLPARGQVTSFDPAVIAPTDSDGMVMLGLRESDLAATGADSLLASLMASGLVEEITAEQYAAALPNAGV